MSLVNKGRTQLLYWTYYRLHMESKFRKLYLYASNAQNAKRMPQQSADSYKLKKQKSIEHLKQLLDIKIGLPPVASLLSFDVAQKLNIEQHQNSAEMRPLRILKPKAKLNTLSPKQSFNQTSSQLLTPFVSVRENINQRRNAKLKLEEQEKQKLYEKYINQYMENLKQAEVLQKYPEENYSQLVAQACSEIRKKINSDLYGVQQASKIMQQSTEREEKTLKKLTKRKHRSKNHSIDSLQIYGSSPSMKTNSSKFILLKENEKQSKSLAKKNLYKLDLDNIERVNEIKQKTRRLSQRQFVRHLTRHSFVETINFPKLQ